MRGNGVTKFLSLWLTIISFLMFERLSKIIANAYHIHMGIVQKRIGGTMLAMVGLAALLTYLLFRFSDAGEPGPRSYTIKAKQSFRLMDYATVFSMVFGCLTAMYFLWKLP